MLIEDLITFGKMLFKEKEFFGKRLAVSSSKAHSIAARSNISTYYFPIVASDNLNTDEVVMIMRAAERSYAMFTRTAFMLIPAVEVEEFKDSMIADYLGKFHSNMGLRHDFETELQLNSASDIKDFNTHSLNEVTKVTVKEPMLSRLKAGIPLDPKNSDGIDYSDTMSFGNLGIDKLDEKTKFKSGAAFINSDWSKANELLPSTLTVPIKFISKDSKEPHTVDVLVNIKAEMHRANSGGLIKSVVDTITHKKTLLNLIKLVSGEEKSIGDFLFGISQMKEDLVKNDKIPFLESFKRRKRLASLAAGLLKNNFMPTGTICLTMNEVNFLKQRYEIDVFTESTKIMNEYFLLGLMIADQTNEILYVKFDSQTNFQEYPYKTLEREGASQDKAIKDMIKAMAMFR